MKFLTKSVQKYGDNKILAAQNVPVDQASRVAEKLNTKPINEELGKKYEDL